MSPKSIFFLFLLVALLLGGLILNSLFWTTKYHIVLPEEVGTEFAINQDNGAVLFTVNSGHDFQIRMLYNGLNSLYKKVDNCFHPFLLHGEVGYLADNEGNENFRFSNDTLNSLTKQKAIRQIFPSPDGQYLIVQLQHPEKILLISVLDYKSIEINGDGVFYSAVYSAAMKSFILSYDGKLKFVNVTTGVSHDYIMMPRGKIKGLYVHNYDLYFSSNANSDLNSIYKLDMRFPKNIILLIKSSEHELLMPKAYENDIYYIEVVNHEYLLRKMNRKGQMQEMTHHGVVYNYDFFNDRIIYIYADLITPRSLLYRKLATSEELESGNKLHTVPPVKSTLLNYNNITHPAYVLSASQTVRYKGIVVFLHPGIETDYSPRWDVFLANLCYNKFLVIAPNLPSSFGWGKKYSEQGRDMTIAELEKLHQYLKKTYTLPVFYVSSSASNVLLEEFLSNKTDRQVKGAVSLFGFPNPEIKIKKLNIKIHYFLGENDPYIDYKKRINDFPGYFQTHYVNSTSYSGEGHWARKSENVQDIIEKTLDLFNDNNTN